MTQAQPKYKPFDLEAAKAGAALITRDGHPAKFVGHVPEVNSQYKVVAFVTGDEHFSTYTEGGALYWTGDDVRDLFMAPTKRTVWVNLYRDSRWGVMTNGRPHSSEAQAKNQPRVSTPDYIGTFPLEYTE